jgi:phosphatidylglycerophosphatase A
MSENTGIGSSSRLLTTVVVSPGIAPVRAAQDQLALAVATCGVGYMPIVPATWASAVTAVVYWILLQSIGSSYANWSQQSTTLLSPELFRITTLTVVIVALTFAGTWAATRVERLFRRKDPKPVVIDEVVGQLITLLFVPFSASLRVIVIGFFVFRAFDILKPYPIRRLESFRGGIGIMADDVLAGVYGSILMLVILRFTGIS